MLPLWMDSLFSDKPTDVIMDICCIIKGESNENALNHNDDLHNRSRCTSRRLHIPSSKYDNPFGNTRCRNNSSL